VFASERGSPFTTTGFARMIERAAAGAGLELKAGRARMGKKERKDDSTKEFKKAVRAVAKPSKKEDKKVDKIVKHLSRKDKI
jgi:hypothetical protein